MSSQAAQWPPQIGDHVQIVATGSSAVVMDGSDGRRFVVAIYSHALGAITDAPLRTFALRELGPESAPSVVVRTATGKDWIRGGSYDLLG